MPIPTHKDSLVGCLKGTVSTDLKNDNENPSQLPERTDKPFLSSWNKTLKKSFSP